MITPMVTARVIITVAVMVHIVIPVGAVSITAVTVVVIVPVVSVISVVIMV